MKALTPDRLELGFEFGGFELGEILSVGLQGYLSRFLEDARKQF
jgi:hypothetical protein